MGKVEVLSKSASDWLTVPMQQRSKSGFIRDWLSATAKDDRYQCTFHYRTSIPYGKGKGDSKYWIYDAPEKVSIPYGKGKAVSKRFQDAKCYCVSIPYGKGKVYFF